MATTFINIEDFNEINDLYNNAHFGPLETWEEYADAFYDKLISLNLPKQERDELIINIKKINKEGDK